jgi:hypothetical protein
MCVFREIGGSFGPIYSKIPGLTDIPDAVSVGIVFVRSNGDLIEWAA